MKVWTDHTVRTGTEVEAYTLGIKAYTWGVTATEMYRWLDSMVLDAGNPRATPFNQFFHDRELAGPNYRGFDIPNSDTLYSYAWLDLSREPLIISTDNSDGRYYSLQFIDFYSEVIDYVGLRTVGSGPAEIFVTAPGWTGEVPSGVIHIESPTDLALLLARVLVEGSADLPQARQIQQGWQIRSPSDRYREKPHKDVLRRGLKRYNVVGADDYYDQLQYVVSLLPPKAKDRVHWAELSRIGLGIEGRHFSDLDYQAKRSFQRAFKHAPKVLDKALLQAGHSAGGGWSLSDRLGRYGDDYIQRSTVTRKGFGAHLPAEAVYYLAHFDENGNFLEGDQRYRIHFKEMKPVGGFWSLTMYDRRQDKLVANPLSRYSVGDNSEGLRRDPQGGLTIYIQRQKPEAGIASNWLPAPDGPFYLALRLYMPEQSVLDGKWQPPAIQRVY